MKFEIIKRKQQDDIDVTVVIIDETEKPKLRQHWKALGITALAASLFTGVAFAYFCPLDASQLEVEMKTSREISVGLGNTHEQERNRASSDGTPTTLNRTSEGTQGEN